MIPFVRRMLRYTGIGLLVILVWSWIAGRIRRRRAAARYRDDARDPFRRWTQGVFGIVSGTLDYADLTSGQARAVLARWWNVHGPRELAMALEELADSSTPDTAWDLVRYVVVTRLGIGAGWMERDEGWDKVRPIARRLQRGYDGWVAVGHAYVVARRAAQGLAPDGSEDDVGMRAILEHISILRDGVWDEIGFHTRFAEPEPPA